MRYEFKEGVISEAFKVGSVKSEFDFGVITESFRFFNEPQVVWILTTGFWNDSAQWIDTEFWNDGVVFTPSFDFSNSGNSQYIILI